MKTRYTLLLYVLFVLSAIVIAACEGSGGDDDDDDTADDDDDDDVSDDDDDSLPTDCDEIYSPDQVPVFEIEIAAEEWEALKYEWAHGVENQDQGLDPTPYHPLISFKYNDEVITDTSIRLKGDVLNWDSSPNKMQFNISFKEINDQQRFHGLRKINLDAPFNDPTMLRERLSLWLFQEIGVPAACVNSARLIVNGEYYGLYTNIEHIDQEFLGRWFGNDDGGNLYKHTEKKTNESDPDTSDLDRFQEDLTLDEIDEIVDLEEAALMWAGEAMIPQPDGYWAGGWNYYLYNHPKRGFIFIPYDLDYTFDVVGHTVDPITYQASWGEGKPNHILVVLENEDWFIQYLEDVSISLDAYDVATMQGLVDQWSAQISDSMDEDVNKPYTTEDHVNRVALLRQYISNRADFVLGWLACKNGDGQFDTFSYNGQDYGFWQTSCSWQIALEFCEWQGGTLALPADAGEQDFLKNKAFELLGASWWIGATDEAVEGTWTDPYGAALIYLPWGSGQPNGDINQNCATVDPDLGGGWNDDYCDLPYPSVCLMP